MRAGLLALAVFLAACGGGGGGGGGNGPTEPTPPQPQPDIVLTPQGAPGANSVALARGAATTATTLLLEVRATGVTDLYGLAYDLTYPSGQLQFVRAIPGALLANGSVQAAVSTPGNLIVGGSLLGPVSGVSGSGVLMVLEFTAGTAGSGSLAFSRNSAIASNGDILSGVTWTGGTVQVIR